MSYYIKQRILVQCTKYKVLLVQWTYFRTDIQIYYTHNLSVNILFYRTIDNSIITVVCHYL